MSLRNWWMVRRARSLIFPTFRDVTTESNIYYAHDLEFDELAAKHDRPSPLLRPYEGLSRYWQKFLSGSRYSYPAYLSRLIQIRGIEPKTALDLGCGTGLLASKLLSIAPIVFGLERSADMLMEASKNFGHDSRLRFVHGDFCDFSFTNRFDIIVSSFNSLNYAPSIEDFQRLVSCVERHLADGGLFVFDTTTSARMNQLNNLYYHEQYEDDRLAMHFDYHPVKRREVVTVHTPLGTERHERIPLDPSDIANAIRNTRLKLIDCFSHPVLPRWMMRAESCIFALGLSN